MAPQLFSRFGDSCFTLLHFFHFFSSVTLGMVSKNPTTRSGGQAAWQESSREAGLVLRASLTRETTLLFPSGRRWKLGVLFMCSFTTIFGLPWFLKDLCARSRLDKTLERR
jgi:hypothetical protein